MKKQFIILILASLLLSLATFAQQVSIKKNSIYAELLGNGGIYSINYDRVFQLNRCIKFTPRIGFATIKDVVVIPLEANILLSRSYTSKNFFEAGVGLTIFKPTDKFSEKFITINGYNHNFEHKSSNIPFIARVGFRHQKPTGGFMYRAGLLLFTGEESLLTAGLGLGYTF